MISEIRKAKERKTSSKDKRPPGAKVKRPLDFEKTFEGNLDGKSSILAVNAEEVVESVRFPPQMLFVLGFLLQESLYAYIQNFTMPISL